MSPPRKAGREFPPGTRTSLYKNADYLKAAPFAELTLKSIESADPSHPTVKPVPYTGVQFVAIPEFQGIATEVGQDFSAALAGTMSVDDALAKAQASDRLRDEEGRLHQVSPPVSPRRELSAAARLEGRPPRPRSLLRSRKGEQREALRNQREGAHHVWQAGSIARQRTGGDNDLTFGRPMGDRNPT